MGLFEAAQAPITFKMLHDEAALHVVMHMATRESLEWTTESGETRSHGMAFRSDIALWVADEAESRAGRIWSEATETEGDHAVLCCYFLPKHFWGQSVTMADFDEPAQRTSERAIRIKNLFSASLRLDRLRNDHSDGDDGVFNAALATLTGKVAEILIEKCAEKFPDSRFYTSNPSTTGDNPS